MADDFRLTVELDLHADAEEFERALAHNLGPAHEASRKKSTLRVYADDEETAERLADEVDATLAELVVGANVILERWNPGAGRWQNPSLPVEELERELEPEEIDFDKLHFQVLVHSPNRFSAGIESRLLREGISAFVKGDGGFPFFFRGGRRLWAGAPTQEEAEGLAERLRLEVPPGSTIRIEPLTRWRRWLATQAIVGNYGGGG